MPEPFEMEIHALRYGVVDLDADSRVPQVGYHAIDVEAARRVARGRRPRSHHRDRHR